MMEIEAKNLLSDAAASAARSSPAENWGTSRKYRDLLEKHRRKSYQTNTLWTIRVEEVKSSFAEAEQNLLLICTLQEAKHKNAVNTYRFGVFFLVNSAESHIKNKTRRILVCVSRSCSPTAPCCQSLQRWRS